MKIAIWKKTILKTACASLLLPATLAFADDHSHDHPHDHGDNPVLTRVIIDQLEIRNADGANPIASLHIVSIRGDTQSSQLTINAESRRNGSS